MLSLVRVDHPPRSFFATSLFRLDDGRVVGIVRNASDPFFIEVRGRIAPNNYNQIGFTGIWPSNIGTCTYVG